MKLLWMLNITGAAVVFGVAVAEGNHRLAAMAVASACGWFVAFSLEDAR